MKKVLSILLSVLMLISVFTAVPLTAGAAATDKISTSATSGDFKYKILDNGAAKITDYTGSATELEIPSSIDGYTVTSIGDYAFEDCTSLTSVTIPDSVTSIGDFAFYGCTSLTSITIPDSVTSIGSDAFEECTSLVDVTIGNGVTSIGGWAFEECTNLTSVTIPDSVTSIGRSAFSGCTGLTNITVGSNNQHYSSLDGNLYNKDQTELIQYTIGKTDEAFVIPDSVTSIGEYAFYGCTSLTDISIPDSVTSIGGGVFYGCTSLTSITIPDSVTSIGDWAFWGCTSLTSITIGNSVTSIGEEAFWGCTSLTNITVGSNNQNYSSLDGNLYNKEQTELIQYAIGKTDKSFVIPDSVKSIGWGTFVDCTSLTSITIPDSVTSVGSYAFDSCTSLSSITIPDSVTNIGGTAFGYFYDYEKDYYSKIDGFTIYGYNGTAAETYANENGFEFISLGEAPVTKPTTATTPSESTAPYDTKIDYLYHDNDDGTCYIYDYVGNDENVVIPEYINGLTVTGIDKSTFSGISLNETIDGIGDYEILTITIPKTVTDIGAGAFKGCTSLNSIYVDSDNTSFKVIDDVLYTADETEIIVYPANRRMLYLYLSKTVDEYSDYAFYNVTTDNLKYIIYDGSLTDYKKIKKGHYNKITANNDIKIYADYKGNEMHWGFNNFKSVIPQEYFTTMYGASAGKKLYTGEKNNGLCYGMSLLSAAISNTDEITPKSLFDKDSLIEVNKNTSLSNTDNFFNNANDLINYAHIYQASYEDLKNEYETRGKITGLIDAVEKAENGKGGNVVINVGSHAVVAEGFLEKSDNRWVIKIYDPNYYNTFNEMEITKTGDGTYKWEMLFAETYNEDTQSIDNVCFKGDQYSLYYFVPDKNLLNNLLSKKKLSAETNGNKVFLSTIHPLWTKHKTYEIKYPTGTLIGEDISEQSSTGLYWVESENNQIVVTPDKASDQIELFGDEIGVKVSADANSTLTFLSDGSEIISAEILSSDNGTVEFTRETGEGTVVCSIEGQCDESATVEYKDEKLVVEGFEENTNITVTNEAGNTVVDITTQNNQDIILDVEEGEFVYQPTNPTAVITDPTESTVVTDPTESSSETTPTASTDPTETTGEVTPTESTGGSVSTDPTESSGTTDPTESTQPTDPVVTDPTESTQPTDPVVTDPTESTQPTTPIVTDPTEVTKATQPDTSAKPKTTVKKAKKANPMTVSVKTKTIKAKKLKKAKQTVKAITVSKAKGKVSYAKVKSGTTKKIFKKVTITKNGKITLKKGKYKKGTYKIKVKITAKGNSSYKSKSKTVTVRVKVK